MADKYDDFERSGNDLLLKDREYANRWAYLVCTSVLLTLLYLWFMVQPEQFREQLNRELNITQQMLTESRADEVVDRSARWYRALFVETGVEGFINGMYVPYPEPDRRGKRNKFLVSYSDFTERAIENTKLVAYRAMLRLNMMFEWMLMAGVLIFAFFADAYYTYRLRMNHFSTQNIKTAALSFRMIFVVLVLMYLYIVVPITSEIAWRFAPLLFIGITIILGTTIIRQYQRM
ncbi:DUF4400 domain-containing protein [uncultured Photobacterium sp.]|uniref:DUF4400 domain-containing protein n=1 Tax=uncultured Photobacterium sp. TaxID=173973 RepID=UPI00261E2E22|nr:DUF4400 domain-containing protein [uncultured Photobacterium sp.]